MILNYGHTIGHAVEAASDFTLKHGQAVAIGMIEENKIAVRKNLLSDNEAARILKVIARAGLPVNIPDFSPDKKEGLLEVLKHDKKVINNKVRFVMLKAIGRPVIVDDIAPGLIREVLYGQSA
jgi:3-dehydroquinate synthase